MAEVRRRRQHVNNIYGRNAGPDRVLRDFENPLDPELVRRHFRMFPAAIMFVCGLVAPQVARELSFGLPVLLQVCVLLKFLGSGGFHINVGSALLARVGRPAATS